MEKEVYTIKDVEEMLDVKYDTASKIIREVRAVSDRLQVRGRIHRLDWEDFLRFRGSV